MDIFAPSSSANGVQVTGGVPMLEEPATLAEQAQAIKATPAGDPNEARITEAVRYMAVNYWGAGKMTGDLAAQWDRLFASLVHGAATAQEVTRAARLADYAMVVALGRRNTKVQGA